jgi:hypothetical protein
MEGLQLKSDLDQWKDATTPKEQRKSASQRVSGFLYKIASKAGDVATTRAVNILIDHLASGLA